MQANKMLRAPMQFSERELLDIDAALCVAADQYACEAEAAEDDDDTSAAHHWRDEEKRLRALMEKIGSRNCNREARQ